MREKTIMKGDYIQIGSLLIVNQTRKSDQGLRKYSIYKMDQEGNAFLFKTYQIDNKDGGQEQLAKDLWEYERTHPHYFIDPSTYELVWINQKHKLIPAAKVQKYKKSIQQKKIG